jgi:hypothetical protein
MPSSYKFIDELAEYLLHKTNIFIELAGHTDSTATMNPTSPFPKTVPKLAGIT